MAAVPRPTVTAVFVYGTLAPGDVRWRFLAPYVADEGVPDSVGGRLFDTGCGYPAAVFDQRAAPGNLIVGRRFTLRACRLDEALAVLDAEESSVAGEFRRVQVTTHAGVSAWAYEYGTGLTLTPIRDGSWSHR